MFVCFLGFVGISATFVVNITVTDAASDRLPNLHYAVTQQWFVALEFNAVFYGIVFVWGVITLPQFSYSFNKYE